MTNSSEQLQPVADEGNLNNVQDSPRSIRDIVADLSRPVNPQRLKQRQQGGKTLDFLPWYQAVRYLNNFAPGWTYEIRSVSELRDMCVVTVRITIPSSDGPVWREATGIEPFDVKGYGDAASNACSMALRRAAAHFGLALSLYDK
jgi:hypothetical protein